MQRVDRMFASDLDGTLIDPRDSQERALARFHDFFRSSKRTALVYVTGRSFEHAIEGIAEAGLPWPDHLCTSVGTELRSRSGPHDAPRWELDEEFRAEIAARLGELVLACADDLVIAHPGVCLQSDAEQREFKRSYRVESGVDVHRTARSLRSALRRNGLRCLVLASVDPVTNRGLLDLLPSGVTKATVVEHLARRFALNAGQVVFAGDAGNDVAALEGPWHGILVGNAEADVRARVDPHHVVVARAKVLAGVLEGLAHLGWIEP